MSIVCFFWFGSLAVILIQNGWIWAISILHEAWWSRKRLARAGGRCVAAVLTVLLLAVVALRSGTPDIVRSPEVPVDMVEAAFPQIEIPAGIVDMNPETAEPGTAQEPETTPPAALDSEAEYMARVLYGTARFNSPEAQKAVCWCIINRCESSIYPDSIEEVCAQDMQWMGYSDDNPIIQDLYDVACEVLDIWHGNGVRMVPPDYLFLSWSEDEIVLRTSFTETNSTHYWRVAG